MVDYNKVFLANQYIFKNILLFYQEEALWKIFIRKSNNPMMICQKG